MLTTVNLVLPHPVYETQKGRGTGSFTKRICLGLDIYGTWNVYRTLDG